MTTVNGTGATGLDRRLAVWLTTANPLVARWLGDAPVDEVWIDMEHGYIGVETLPALLMAIGSERRCRVRLPEYDPSVMERAWAAGATGVIIPHVTSAELVEKAVAAAMAIGRQSMSVGEAETRPGPEIGILIEDAVAVKYAASLLGVRGVALAIVGRTDLGRSLGTDNLSAEVEEASRRVLELGRRHGIPVALGLPPSGHWPTAGWKHVAATAATLVIGHDHDLLTLGAHVRVGAIAEARVPNEAAQPRLWNVGCKVQDIETEIEFFEAFGARVRLQKALSRDGESVPYAMLDWAGTRLFLTPTVVFEPSLITPLRPGLTHVVVEVPDVGEAVSTAGKTGGTVRLEPTAIEGGFGTREIAFVESPGGVIVEFIRIEHDALAETLSAASMAEERPSALG
jgi:2-keto-3-deoxy-L-rhamnonate aldolase RhmA